MERDRGMGEGGKVEEEVERKNWGGGGKEIGGERERRG